MVWVFRVCLALLIAAYATWLAWPLLEMLRDGGSVSALSAAIARETGRVGPALTGLWIGSITFYLLSSVLTAGGIGAAPGAYFVGFLGEVVSRLLLQSTAGAAFVDTPARIGDALRPMNLAVDPGPLSLAALLAVGLLVMMTGAWRGRTGQALTRHWTEPPVYA